MARFIDNTGKARQRRPSLRLLTQRRDSRSHVVIDPRKGGFCSSSATAMARAASSYS
jgi:hypothetical protein